MESHFSMRLLDSGYSHSAAFPPHSIGMIIDGLIVGAIVVTIAFVLHRVIGITGSATKPLEVGRKWCAWAVALATVATLWQFFPDFNVDALAVWMLHIVVYGLGALVLGWLYGAVFHRFPASQISRHNPSYAQPASLPPRPPQVSLADDTLANDTPSHAIDLSATHPHDTQQPDAYSPSDDHYEEASKEIRKNRFKEGLMARCFYEGKGDQNRANALYIGLRSQELAKAKADTLKQNKDNVVAPTSHPIDHEHRRPHSSVVLRRFGLLFLFLVLFFIVAGMIEGCY